MLLLALPACTEHPEVVVHTQGYQVIMATLRILHDEHHMLVAAIRDGDSEEAERVLFGHIRRTRLQLSRHPEVFA